MPLVIKKGMEYKPRTNIEKLFFSTVKLNIKKEDGSLKSATGCFISYEWKKNYHTLFLVTNKHVIQKSKDITLIFNKRTENNAVILGDTIKFRLKNIKKAWYPHQNDKVDLTIFDFGETLNYFIEEKDLKEIPYITPISKNIIYNEEKQDFINPIEEIIFIGYPRGLYDKSHNLPFARKGLTSTLINIDYKNLPVFIIDASVFPGSSGSPVYVCNYGGYYLNSKKDVIMGPRTIFLGILSTAFKNIEGNFLIDLNSEISDEESEKPYLDLGVVIKSQTIMDLIKNYLEISED